MTVQIILNLLIAFIWMLLNESWNVVIFAVGYVIGFFIILAMRRFFPDPFYGKKSISIIKLLFLFIVELFKSSVTVIVQILRPKLNIKPGIFRTETILETDFEVSLLITLLTLTPGSVIMEYNPNAKTLYMHAMDTNDFHKNIQRTKVKFENAIIEVMR